MDQPAISEIWYCSGRVTKQIERYSGLNLEVSERDKHNATDAMVRSHVVEKCLNLQKSLFDPEIDEATAKDRCGREGNCMGVVSVITKTIEGR